ncbi:MAG: AAA family ATPase [Planctomycetota bacterium]
MNAQANGLRRASGRRPDWLVVTGGKGGVGKTVVAANLATLAARSGRKTLLVDLDSGTANLHVHFRRSPKFTLEDAASSRCSPMQALTVIAPKLAALFGSSGPSELALGSAARMHRAYEIIDEVAKDFDLVVCDTGSSMNAMVLEAARRANVQVAVTGSDPASVTDTYALLKTLHHAELPAPALVVNNVQSLQEATATATRLSKTASTFLGHTIDLIGWVRTDRAVRQSIIEQRPLCRRNASGAASDLQALFARSVASLSDSNQRPRISPSFV